MVSLKENPEMQWFQHPEFCKGNKSSDCVNPREIHAKTHCSQVSQGKTRTFLKAVRSDTYRKETTWNETRVFVINHGGTWLCVGESSPFFFQVLLENHVNHESGGDIPDEG